MSEENNNGTKGINDLAKKPEETNEEYFERLKSLKKGDIVLLRGATPEDFQLKAHKWCSDYLGGAWLEIKAEQIVINRISGGMTNQLYQCTLPEDVKTMSDEPREIALRLYGPKHFGTWDEKNERFSDTVVSVILSEKNIGPKIYGVFPEGEIQKFYKAHQIGEADENNPLIVKELAVKLARFHAIKFPLGKQNFMFDNFDKLYRKAYDKCPELDKLFVELELKTLLSHDLKKEIDWLRAMIQAFDSPVVFVHHDYRDMNILVKEEDGVEGSMLVVCDFEYACHGYRGLDFGWLWSQWGKKSFEKTPLPSDDVIKPFLEEYIRESTLIRGQEWKNDKRNQLERMLRETKTFHLMAQMFGLLICLCLESDGQIENLSKENMLRASDFIFSHYLSFKQDYIDQKIIEYQP